MKQKSKITTDVVNKVAAWISSGMPESESRKQLRELLNLGKSQGNAVYNQIVSGIKVSSETGTGLEFVSSRYTYNKENDSYIFNLKCRLKPLVLHGSKVKSIVRSYSSWGEDLTTNEICRTYSLTPEIFGELRSILNLTKDKEPLTSEEVLYNSVEQSVEQIIEEKRYRIYQKYEKEDWKQTQVDAAKWREFCSKQLDPFARFIHKWEPPPNYKIQRPKKNNDAKRALLVNIADIHVGAKADERFLYRQKNWRHSDLVDAMKDYCNKIYYEISDRKTGFDKCIVTLGGDIAHTLSGYTDGNTKLDYEFIGEDQIDYAFSLLVAFINEMLSIFSVVDVKSVNGNHSYLGDYVIAKLLQTYYRNNKDITFDITSKRYLPFKIMDTLVILDHGASGKGIKSKLPGGALARDSYIQGILLDKPEMLLGTKSRIFLTNDKHHYEHIERSDFDLIISPSIVGGDLYSDFNCWKSRPAQSLYVIDEDGLKETIRIYFD